MTDRDIKPEMQPALEAHNPGTDEWALANRKGEP
jgi:hypothetical protein